MVTLTTTQMYAEQWQYYDEGMIPEEEFEDDFESDDDDETYGSWRGKKSKNATGGRKLLKV